MLKNSKTSYGWIAIMLHWLVAAAVFGLFGLGLYMVDLSYYDALYKTLPDLHRSIGLTLLFVLLLRIGWRISNPKPAPLAGWSRVEIIVSAWLHKLLYWLLLATILAGYLISTADGRGIEVFWMFEVPALLPAIKGMEDIAGEIHEILAWVIIGAVGIHVTGALKHHLVDKDNTLRRILKPRSESN